MKLAIGVRQGLLISPDLINGLFDVIETDASDQGHQKQRTEIDEESLKRVGVQNWLWQQISNFQGVITNTGECVEEPEKKRKAASQNQPWDKDR